jgi:hypothetical protein
MTKKDYEKLATALSNARGTFLVGEHYIKLVEEVSTVCAGASTSFNPQYFEDACHKGVTK